MKTFESLLGNNSTKGFILNALSEKPLTLKQLHQLIERNTTNGISYQATHKAVTEMIDDGVLSKKSKSIEINSNWIENVQKAVKELKSKKLENNQANEQFEFDNFVDYGKFVISFFHDTPNPENKPGICILKHAYPVFGMDSQDYEKLSKLLKDTTFYDLIQENTPLDKMFSDMLKQLGKKTKTGVKIKLPFDVICKGEKTAYIYFTEDFKKKFDRVFKEHRELNKININQLMAEFVMQKTKINVLIVTDKITTNNFITEAIQEYD